MGGEPPGFPDGPSSYFIIAFGVGFIALAPDEAAVTGLFAAGSVGMLLLAIHSLRKALRERPAVLAAHAEHLRRARMTWARIVDAEIVGERRGKHGVLVSYEIAVKLEVWPTSGAPDAVLPVPVSHRLTVPGTVGASVAPGAYLGVLHDPVDHRLVPQSLVTRDGAQLPL